jgi:DNA-binding transcriptional ArsR family regulator
MRRAFKAEFFKALAHPLRIQILDELREGPLNVTELRDRLGVEQSTLSQQLAVLRARNLVTTERFGNTIRYEVCDPCIWRLLDCAHEIFDKQLVSVQSLLEELRSQA